MEGATNLHACSANAEVMALVETLPYVDLFLVDIYLLGETGYDLIKQIRAHSKLQNSKVVALTASVMYDDIRRVKKAGFDGFVGKPVRPACFGAQVKQILAGESLWDWR